jgi:hypothetical protein
MFDVELAIFHVVLSKAYALPDKVFLAKNYTKKTFIQTLNEVWPGPVG